jgi:hypothetical protein
MGPRNAYTDMLDNVVSPITCVSMNHQNQLEQMANGAMFATTWTMMDPLMSLSCQSSVGALGYLGGRELVIALLLDVADDIITAANDLL